MKKTLMMLVLAMGTTSCLHTTIREDGKYRNDALPANYEGSQSFYLWGLVPDKVEIDISSICADKGFDQLQTKTTFIDGFLGFITFGIYSPKTASVWCKNS